MMVSRHVVDIVEIGGLVVGTLGVFCLSHGVLGLRVETLLRRILVATVYAVLFGLVSSAFFSILAPASQNDRWMVTLVSAAVGLVWGLGVRGMPKLTYPKYSNDQQSYEEWAYRARWKMVLAKLPLVHPVPAGLAICLIMLAPAITLLFDNALFKPVLLVSAGIMALALLNLLAVYVLLPAAYMRARTLEIVGLILTLLGIATQFISPILDLLNVPVR